MRGRRVAAWSVGILGFDPGTFVRRVRKLGWWALALLFVAVGLLQYAWAQWPWAFILVGAVLVALLGMNLWARWSLRQADHAPPLRRTTGDLYWVYVLGEWRDDAGRLIPRADAAFRKDRNYHLVYVGYTSDWERRIRQHATDKPWFHDELVIDPRSHWYGSERAARRAEEALIASERPRENKQHNPNYDPWKSAEMRARA